MVTGVAEVCLERDWSAVWSADLAAEGFAASTSAGNWVPPSRLLPVRTTGSRVPFPSVIRWRSWPARSRPTGDGPAGLPCP